MSNKIEEPVHPTQEEIKASIAVVQKYLDIKNSGDRFRFWSPETGVVIAKYTRVEGHDAAYWLAEAVRWQSIAEGAQQRAVAEETAYLMANNRANAAEQSLAASQERSGGNEEGSGWTR